VSASAVENTTSEPNFDSNVLRIENAVSVDVTANSGELSGLDKGGNRPREGVIREDYEGRTLARQGEGIDVAGSDISAAVEHGGAASELGGQTLARLGGSLALPGGGVPFVLTENDAVTNSPNEIEAPS
jgi:hypothetical protein